MRGLLLAAILAMPAAAQEWNNACFHGLNDADSPAVLGNCESPDLLNVEANLSGSAILKRKGFSEAASLTITTAPVTGSHSFIDSAGNRLDIVCQDRNCAKSTNGNAFATFLTTAASGITRWSFVDQGGILYGANDRRDPIFRYDGTTFTSPVGMPQGSILELTQDRLAIGDISGQPNRIHFSSAGAYEQFTVGVNPEDSFFDDVGAAGDRIRGIKCVQGSCFIFKTASITLYEMGDQYTTQGSVISPSIGTTDPASIVAAGSDLYFRAQDKNYWRIGRSGLEQISRKIPNLVKSQSGGLGGGENTNTQTTKADWDAGDQEPNGSWNTLSVNGSVFPSSSVFTDNTAALWNQGTFTGPLAINATGSLVLGAIPSSYTVRYEANETPASASPPWEVSDIDGGGSDSVSSGVLDYLAPPNSHRRYRQAQTLSSTQNNLIVFRAKTDNLVGGVSGIGFWNSAYNSVATYGEGFFGYIEFEGAHDGVGNTTKYKTASGVTLASEGLTTSFSTFTILVSSFTSGQAVVRFWKDGIFITSGAITVVPDTVVIEGINNTPPASANWHTYIDYLYYGRNVGDPGNVDIGVSTFTSRIFDTGFSTSISAHILATGSANSGLTYSVRNSTSPNNDMWSSLALVSSGTASHIDLNKRYWQYQVLFATNSVITGPELTGVDLIAATTGQFTTQCIQPNASISAWGTLSCAHTLGGAGSLVYYATSAVSCAALPVSTAPVNSFGTAQAGWTQQTNNATLSIATNTAVFIGWRSLLGSATDQAQVDACVLSWNEGTPSQPSWAAYDSRKQAIYWTSTIDGASATNRLLKYDLNLGEWFPWNIAAQAPRVINNELYFGGASAGTWNKYGLVDSDAGASINAYWTSKDVGSDRPFQGKDFKTLSVLNRNQGSGTLTGTWTNSIGNTGNYTISLSTGTGIQYARSNFSLPKKSPQAFMKVKFGNNSSTPFEVLGIGLTWQVLPWRVEP